MNNFKIRDFYGVLYRIFLIALFSVISPQICNAQNAAWGGAFKGALDSLNEMLDRKIEEERQQKLLDQQFEQQKKLLEYQYQMEREKSERESSARQRQIDEQRRLEQIAEDQKRSEEAEQRRNAVSTGTGFFVAPNGYLITNHHVVEGSSYYAVRDQRGNFYRAEVVAQDASRDLALLRIHGTFATLKIARSDSVSKGQRVMAVGYPQISIQGNESKVTDGVISSFSGMNNDPNWFQISTPIQGGNSGGPLVTEAGQVVGVVVATANAMKFFKNTGNIPQNVNYAIKSNVLLGFLTEQKISNGGASSTKFSIDEVDRSTVLVIAKNSPIDVNFSVSPEQRADQEREKAKTLAEDARRQKLEADAERKALALSQAEEARAKKEQLASEQREKEDALRKEKRDKEISRSVSNWKELQEDELFVAWLKAQSADFQVKLDSAKAGDVVFVFRRFQLDRKDFSENYFQTMGTWLADAKGCRFLNRKPEPNESLSWTGQCEDGRGTGQGELLWMKDGAPNQRASGIFKNGMLNGLGRTETIGADSYAEGTYKNNRLEGFGKSVGKDGSSYQGEFRQGKPNGRGKLNFGSGNSIEGNFTDGRLQGAGKYTGKDGGYYEGNFRESKFDGVGKQVFSDGSVYQGDYKEGKRSGHGKVTHKNGNWMEGEFSNGELDGQGKFVWIDGGSYEGAFKNSKFHGYGKKITGNGHIYEGYYENGKEEGSGTITFVNGVTKTVLMKDGKIIRKY